MKTITKKIMISAAIATVMASVFGLNIQFQPKLIIGTEARGDSVPVTSSQILVSDPNLFVTLAEKAVPSVVNIATVSTVRPMNMLGFGTPDELFGQLFGGRSFLPQQQQKRGALGTGFVIDDSGIILTNNHVIDGSDQITITFTEDPNEAPVPAKVLGADPELDVALLKVETFKKPLALKLGDSDSLKVGEYVAAIGNPFGQGHSMSHGILSAKGRHAPGLPAASWLQTDAPINPGNSGGPLLNLKGEVIGMNTAIDARAQGIGFAIPINAIKSEISDLKSYGKITRGFLGATLTDYPGVSAALIHNVIRGQPADRAGLTPGDQVIEYGGKRVNNSAELSSLVVATRPDQVVAIKLLRGGKPVQLELKIGERPTQLARS